MELQEFAAYVDDISNNEIPAILLKDLNLGIQVSPNNQLDDDEKNYYIMGQYIRNELGNQVILYYGSFKYFFKNKSIDKWKREIMATIKHELIHHVEAMAGQEDLALQEDIEMANRKKSKNKKHLYPF